MPTVKTPIIAIRKAEKVWSRRFEGWCWTSLGVLDTTRCVRTPTVYPPLLKLLTKPVAKTGIPKPSPIARMFGFTYKKQNSWKLNM